MALLIKRSKFNFGPSGLEAFGRLKEIFISPPDMCVIAYVSRRIKPCEYSLFMFQLELLSTVFLCSYFVDYLMGRASTVHTDSKLITELRTIFTLDSRTTRLQLKLQDFNLKFVYLPGRENFVADTLAHFPPEDTITRGQHFSDNVIFT